MNCMECLQMQASERRDLSLLVPLGAPFAFAWRMLDAATAVTPLQWRRLRPHPCRFLGCGQYHLPVIHAGGPKLCVLLVLLSAALPFYLGCTEGREPVVEAPTRAGLGDSAQSTEREDGRVVLEHDFGVVAQATELEWVFRVANGSSDIWRIQTVRSDCGCAVASVSSEVIQPGAAATVRVALTTASESREQVNRVVIRFADPEVPLVLLRTVAHVRGDMTVAPESLTFVGKQPKGMSVTVRNFSKKDWGDLQVKCAAPWVVISRPVEIEERVATESMILLGRQAWRFNASISPELAQHEEERAILAISAVTDSGTNAEEAALTIPVAFSNPADVCVVPSEFFFGVLESDQEAIETVEVRFREEIASRLSSSNWRLASVPDRLFVQSRRLAPQCWELKAKFTPLPSDAVVSGKVCVDFDDEAFEDLEIPFRALVKQRGAGKK